MTDCSTSGDSLQWAQVWTDPYPLGAQMLMLLLDSVLYFALASYFDRVRDVSGPDQLQGSHCVCIWGNKPRGNQAGCKARWDWSDTAALQ